eukprot:scaffold3122_cov207-Skeletonema_menzelii.AAC.1
MVDLRNSARFLHFSSTSKLKPSPRSFSLHHYPLTNPSHPHTSSPITHSQPTAHGPQYKVPLSRLSVIVGWHSRFGGDPPPLQPH